MYLGIDPSLSCTAFSLINKKMEQVALGTIKYGPSDPYRLYNYYSQFKELLCKNNIENVGIEFYAFGKAGSSMSFNIGEHGGSLRIALQELKIDKVIYPLPTEVKKFFTNYARSEKEEVKQILEDEYGYEIISSRKSELLDLSDSLAISIITYYFFNRKKRKNLKTFQKEILNNLKNRRQKQRLKLRY